MNQIGQIEILRTRIYALDPESTDPNRQEVIVEPGSYPIYRDGVSTFWMMRGKLNQRGIFPMGDGMFGMRVGDFASDVEVQFPSKRFGPDEWANLLTGPEFAEGNPEQRLRVMLDAAEVTA